MNKNGTTFTGLFLSIILVIVIFFGTFGYISNNYESAGITDSLGPGINDSVSYWNQNLTDAVTDVRSSTENIAEADGNIVQVAWNGLTGLASTLNVFFVTITIAVGLWDALFPALVFLPIWFKLLVESGIVIWIVLLILGAFKGEAKT